MTNANTSPAATNKALADQISALQGQLAGLYKNYFLAKNWLETIGNPAIGDISWWSNAPSPKSLSGLFILSQDAHPDDVKAVYDVTNSGLTINTKGMNAVDETQAVMSWQILQADYAANANEFFTANGQIHSAENTLKGLTSSYETVSANDPAVIAAQAAAAAANAPANVAHDVTNDVMIAAGALALTIIIIFLIKS